jgi:hypothetical protein
VSTVSTVSTMFKKDIFSTPGPDGQYVLVSWAGDILSRHYTTDSVIRHLKKHELGIAGARIRGSLGSNIASYLSNLDDTSNIIVMPISYHEHPLVKIFKLSGMTVIQILNLWTDSLFTTHELIYLFSKIIDAANAANAANVYNIQKKVIVKIIKYMVFYSENSIQTELIKIMQKMPGIKWYSNDLNIIKQLEDIDMCCDRFVSQYQRRVDTQQILKKCPFDVYPLRNGKNSRKKDIDLTRQFKRSSDSNPNCEHTYCFIASLTTCYDVDSMIEDCSFREIGNNKYAIDITYHRWSDM